MTDETEGLDRTQSRCALGRNHRRYIRSARAAYGKQIEVPAKILPEFPAVSVTVIVVWLASTVVTLVTVKVFATFAVAATLTIVVSRLEAVKEPL